MSDLSPMEQSFALGPATQETGLPMRVPVPETAPRLEVSPHEVQLRALTTPREVASIQHLRRQIQLPAGVLASPGFATLEKKETKRGSSPRSSGVISPSAR
jgi:hypothetical protein